MNQKTWKDWQSEPWIKTVRDDFTNRQIQVGQKFNMEELSLTEVMVERGKILGDTVDAILLRLNVINKLSAKQKDKQQKQLDNLGNELQYAMKEYIDTSGSLPLQEQRSFLKRFEELYPIVSWEAVERNVNSILAGITRRMRKESKE